MIWTWPNFGPALFNCIILYLSAGLVLPGRRNSDSESLLMDFEKHGRLSLVTLATMLVVVSILNGYYFADLDSYYHLSHWLSTANILNIVLLTLIFIVLLTKRFALQVAGTVMSAILQTAA